MLLCGAVRVAEAEHLHLVELVDSEHPARVSPRCTGLAAEAAGVPYIAQGQVILREYLFHMQGRERYLRRTHQVKVCLLYTSDAADDLTRVDLGGRRIIKKKKNHRKKD